MSAEGREQMDEDEQVRALRDRRQQVKVQLAAALTAVEAARAELRHIDASICAVWDGKPASAVPCG